MSILNGRAKRKLREWIFRYLPAEINGTINALVGFWLGYWLSGSLAFAAVAGTVGENIGYYGMMAFREAIRYWRQHQGQRNMGRAWLAGTQTVRNMLVEFGPAEVIDSFFVRPGLFYFFPLWFSGHMALAVIAAKIAADLVFYLFAIIGFELRKKFLPDKFAPVDVSVKEEPPHGRRNNV